MLKYHILALCTVAIWGSTLTSSKILISNGLNPAEIMGIRFLIGYLFTLFLYPKFHKVKSWTDETLFLCAGLFGGSVYFLTENYALYFTQTTNVALIVATVPIATALLSHFLTKEKITKKFISGAVIAFAGVSLIVLNGHFILKLNPAGDMLALASVISWALYCILQKKFKHEYNSLYFSRKTFFYGLITVSPHFFIFPPEETLLESLQKPVVVGNLIFLSILATSLCYTAWSIAMKHIGVIAANSYIYLLPLITLTTSFFFLNEKISIFTIAGAAMAILGVWISRKKN